MRSNSLVIATLLLVGGLAAAQDRVVLLNGTVLEGRVVEDGADAVTIALDFGGKVSFKRQDVRSVVKKEAPAEPAPAAPSRDTDREEWRYLIYHGDAVVGFRTVIRTRDLKSGRRGTLLQDEVVFRQPGQEACKVLTLEFEADEGGYRTLYYREVGMGTDTIVDARTRNGRLHYSWRRGGKRTFHDAALAPDVKFPLELWFARSALSSAQVTGEWGHRVWDPKSRKIVSTTTRLFEPMAIAVGNRKLRVTPLRVQQPRGSRLRWLASDGSTLKEYLNGGSLASVQTARPGVPVRKDGARRPDQAELAMARVLIRPGEGIALRLPGAGWRAAANGYPGATLTLANVELKASVVLFWGGLEGEWPGPGPNDPARVKPEAFGGWPGEGWQDVLTKGEKGRERVVRRMQTLLGRVSLVLEAPPDVMAAALVDFAELLRSVRVPGTGRRGGD